jgi:hypothetical protein
MFQTENRPSDHMGKWVAHCTNSHRNDSRSWGDSRKWWGTRSETDFRLSWNVLVFTLREKSYWRLWKNLSASIFMRVRQLLCRRKKKQENQLEGIATNKMRRGALNHNTVRRYDRTLAVMWIVKTLVFIHQFDVGHKKSSDLNNSFSILT